MRSILAAVAALSLGACSFTSTLAPNNSKSMVEASPASSERTYRTILPVLRDCFPINTAIESNYFPEAREGDIVVAMSTENVRVELLKLAIAPANSGASVKMTRNQNYDKFDKALAAWIDGKDGGCPYGTRVEAPYATHNPYSTAPR
ncbi:hypothetical protein [Variovorax ginsengisoli]|uniref:Lipoprotein n=1 Tax=Variovorax ginsengisoli TaxID=363844 RepID=A0ABT8SE41_9BURK|nr:hypothetical protein [Variovorax ginsengisoli]MDN8617830.1 hypothetical protein [Variovorax ginsengisoli]MDO1537000.1 hypothetical protein [Variovorax ginsengisoli]